MTVVERRAALPLRRLPAPVGRRTSAHGLWPRRLWLVGLAGLAAWAWFTVLLDDADLLNPGGWTHVGEFVTAAARPELDPGFLRGVVVPAIGTTLGYAVVGTALALLIGLVGGVLTSDTFWRRDPLAAGRRRSSGARWLVTAGATLARGAHEAVWAVLLLSVLGRNPWVAVLAIGIPFGAVTAKVVAETLDDADPAPVEVLRAAGTGRITAVTYGLGSTVLPDLVSYAFYRFECAVRSSVVLGMIGAGGIGFELTQSFQSLRYHEIWTLIYVICAVAFAVDRWGASLRRRPSGRAVRASLIAAVAATAVAGWWLDLRLGSLVDARTRRLTGDLVTDMFPPRLPAGGWAELGEALLDTVQMSVLAITIAAAAACPLAFAAARRDSSGRFARTAGATTRGGLLLMRSFPPTVWAFVVLLVVFPGPLPGGLALGAYTAGVLARLDAEVVENADPSGRRALRDAGASATAAFAYGSLPLLAPRFASLALYRWEVVLRETVIVGLVGAGGLGRLLAHQNVAFDEPRMLTTILTLVVAAFVVDLVSGRVRSALR